MNDNKTEIMDMNQAELENWMLTQVQPPFRARQIYKWIYQKDVNSFYDMSDLPKDLRAHFDSIAAISFPRFIKQRASADGSRKFLLELKDKKRVETVLIPHSEDAAYSICLSTQIGCPIGCSFCATGQSLFQRNLTASEITGQVLSSRRELARKVKQTEAALISNVVYMGMGEPLLNYDATVESIYTINEHRGINIGQRHITLSTCGEASGIRRLASEGLQITLAVSLHAPNDRLRDSLIPINHKYPLAALMKAVDEYIMITNRRVTFEYLLLDQINMQRSHVEELIALVKPRLVNLNLIPYNEVAGLPFKTPPRSSVEQFYRRLADAGLTVTLRRKYGDDIAAACGQLSAPVRYGGYRGS